MIYCLFPAVKYSFDCSNLNKIRVKIQSYNNALLVKKKQLMESVMNY